MFNAVIIAITIFLSALGIFSIIWKLFRNDFLSYSTDKKSLEEINEKHLKYIEDKFAEKKYIKSSEKNIMRSFLLSLKDDIYKIDNKFLKKEKSKLEEIFQKELLYIDQKIDQKNANYLIQERELLKLKFKDSHGVSELNDEQIDAVLCDDDRNLIVAGAGSGKTRVIEYKVKYLIQHKQISPKKILILSYSKKSASDLQEKISKISNEVEVRTIHSLGSKILGQHGLKLFDPTKGEQDQVILKSIVKTLQNNSYYRIFNAFYSRYFSELKPLIFYENISNLRRDLKKVNSKFSGKFDDFGDFILKKSLKTMRGEYVRSVDERFIADYLFLNEINYEYEKRYPHTKEAYYPDFYLTDYNIYLEHFAITQTGRPPPFFDNPEKYMSSIDWKRNLHKQNNTKMIESLSYQLNEKDSSEYLNQLLIANGIEIKNTQNREREYQIISKEFLKFMFKFYTSYKLSQLKIDDLLEKYSSPQYSLFLIFFKKFLDYYENALVIENKIDFNDLLLHSKNKILESTYHQTFQKYDYIIVDEFQDTSHLAMTLIHQIFYVQKNACLFVVGDDWQSIYGFNGSDVSILSNYSNNYPGVLTRYLQSNFRSHSNIVELGKKFISKNSNQISKNVISKNAKFEKSEIDFIHFEKMEQLIKSIPDDESIFVLYRYNDDSPALKGIFNDYFLMGNSGKIIKKSHINKNIQLLTIHGSKGLQARHVFVLFPDSARRKFPSEIEDHFIYNILKTNPDNYPFSEERRLMYVAITRAEQNLYFVSHGSDDENVSVFLDELKELVKGS